MNNNLDDIINGKNNNKESFDKTAWAEKKQKEREQVFEMIDDTASSVINDEVSYKQYLDVVSRFDKYSAENALLIFAQKPKATRLADASRWKKQDVYIKKGEKGISILEPGNKYKRKDGTESIGFNVKKLFDISQTNATKETETSVKYDDRLILKALLKDAPVPTNISDNLRENTGAAYDHRTKQILVRQGMDGTTIIRTVAQEMAHAYIASDIPKEEAYNRLANSFAAHSVSYIICKRTGIDTSEFTFGKVKDIFTGLNSREIRAELSKMRAVANEIWSNMLVTLNPPVKNKTEQVR